MNSQSSDVEILVHTTAPSRIIDDAAYRQLAQSYLAFQPTSKALVVSSSQLRSTATTSQSQSCSYEQQRIPSTPDLPLCRDSQDLSFQGAFGNRSSPRLRNQSASTSKRSPQCRSSQTSPTARRSRNTPPSEVADSYPMPDLGFFKVTPTRALSRYVVENASSVSALDSSPSPILGNRIARTSNSLQTINIPSSIPVPSSDSQSHKLDKVPTAPAKDTIPVTPIVKDATNKHPPCSTDIQDPDLADITHISSSIASNTSVRAESEPPPKRPKPSQVPAQVIPRSVSDTGPEAASVLSSFTPSSSAALNLYESYPPSPPVSIDNLTPNGLISEKLRKLATDLSSRYRPRPHRPIEPLERGFWHIDCSTWDDISRIDTWSFLHNYIQSGLAGWGVWCRREEEKASSLRLYGWGHVVKHTYLLLYLASGRRIKTTGAIWYAADGEATITVPPIERA